MSKPLTLSETLRRAMRGCGLTRYRLAQQAGIAEHTVSRFMAGDGGLRLSSADALAELLGLHLTQDPNATPPEPTPANLARPTLAKRKKQRTTKRRTR
ncbi:MAG: helix-turn-helix transcriptional regulator [Thermoguttaceae bacterium]|jgi:transcriptional regulator with XRE-family HTH domain|nr:helix-turn-helix transcriptional regulator [Thermoguttaceae bacterium]